MSANPRKPASASGATTSNFQCSLYGVCLDSTLPKLLERLAGVCGHIGFDNKENLFEHEIVFIPIDETPLETRKDDVVLRLCSDCFEDGKFVRLTDRKWKLGHRGAPDPPKERGDIVQQRAVYEAPTSGDVFQYLKLIGYRYHFEFVRQGFTFVYHSLKITVSRLYQLSEKHRVSSKSLLEPFEDMWMVEITGPLTSQENAVRGDLQTFGTFISGYGGFGRSAV
ncbi:Mediator of RNA polymerase II transcription subunit 18 [Borealophlyctis nickersoniae]|nr:Mediator of RNA polymerase II transcription subunit 18 [Borealophlyctis nickersoniae]